MTKIDVSCPNCKEIVSVSCELKDGELFKSLLGTFETCLTGYRFYGYTECPCCGKGVSVSLIVYGGVEDVE